MKKEYITCQAEIFCIASADLLTLSVGTSPASMDQGVIVDFAEYWKQQQ